MSAANCFAQAAASYDQHAQLQRWAGDLLINRANSAGRWLDIGCGTGYVTERLPGFDTIGIDIAMPMLRQQHGGRSLQADMQSLPLRAEAVAAVAANLSLQWSPKLAVALAETHRVCQAQGQLLFTVPAHNTFPELASLVDNGQLACNRFPDQQSLKQTIAAAGWHDIQVHTHQCVLYFDDAKALLKHFKLTGAQFSARQPGLRGRGWWQNIEQQLEQLRQGNGLPLTWRIYLAEAYR